MSIKARTEGNGKIGIIEVKGALVGDEDTDKFRESVYDFIEQGNKCLIIDLHKVNYLNSTGIGAIIAAHTAYAKNAGVVKLAGITDNVQNLLVVTKLIDIFDVYENLDQAIGSAL
jgi:anti-sigma B factor antagonist